MFKRVVTSEGELRELLGEPSERAVKKETAALGEPARAFIALSPFLLLATSNAKGKCDVSPKGDAPGFVLVLDDTHLVIPDRPGNNRIDGMSNVLENPHVGMIFLVPGREDTLRVNGRAVIARDAEFLARLEVQGKRPKVAIGVEVEEAYLHCPKAFRRSSLWDPATWADPRSLPSFAQMLWDQVPVRPAGATTVEDYAREQEKRLREGLY